MALINWNPSYSVKIGEIDSQHQKLITMINELNDAMLKGKAKDILSPLIDGLIAYTQVHFSKEEMLFDKYKYPDTPAHKEEHAAFVKKVSEFREGFKKGNMSLTINIMDFLSNWLTKHICGTDKKYSDFLNSNGVK
ncbi:MAG: hemerythrin family protein [Elusimicrobia bacterium]|nr:hemerythrin family protein [Elusimicrobiota bacterium]